MRIRSSWLLMLFQIVFYCSFYLHAPGRGLSQSVLVRLQKMGRASLYSCRGQSCYYRMCEFHSLEQELMLKMNGNPRCIHAQLCPTLCHPLDCTYQVPLCVVFFRQECWRALLSSLPRDLPDPGIEPVSPALQAGSLSLSHQGSQSILGLGPKQTRQL